MQRLVLFMCFFSAGSLACQAQQPSQSLQSQQPIEQRIDEASAAMAQTMAKGLHAIDDDGDGKVALIDAIKVLRRTGFGKTTDSGALTGRPPGRGRGGTSNAEGRNGGGSGRHGGGSGRHGGGSGRQGGGSGRHGGGGHSHSSGGHSAPTTPEETRAKFDQRDLDRDGEWRKDEINAYMSGQPAANDGVVTFAEYSAAWTELRGGRAAQDSDPAAVTEQPPSDTEFFVSLDADRDRMIDADEVRLAIADALKKLSDPSEPPQHRSLGRAIRRMTHQTESIAVCLHLGKSGESVAAIENKNLPIDQVYNVVSAMESADRQTLLSAL